MSDTSSLSDASSATLKGSTRPLLAGLLAIGVGLGLSLAYGVIQQHGGQITVRSQVGIGTAFRVSLPMRQGDSTLPGVSPVPAGTV